MKATGILRRVDDLGRVVIPREIRKVMRIREGEPLEIYIDEDSVIFKKYSELGQHYTIFAEEVRKTLMHKWACEIVICDCDTYIATSNGLRHLRNKPLSIEMRNILNQRNTYVNAKGWLAVEEGKDFISCVVPIISNGDLCGGICFVESIAPTEGQIDMMETMATLISNHMNIPV